jgi:hypothetical protein
MSALLNGFLKSSDLFVSISKFFLCLFDVSEDILSGLVSFFEHTFMKLYLTFILFKLTLKLLDLLVQFLALFLLLLQLISKQ